MYATRCCLALVLCLSWGCGGLPGLGTMVGQAAGGANPGMTRGEPAFLSEPDNNVELADAYRFSYRVTMRITNDGGTVERVFYMHPDASYYARRQSREGFTQTLVYDNQNDLVVLFAEKDGERRRIHNRMNVETKAMLVGAYRDAPQKEPVQSLGTKTLLGYPTRGYRISTLAGTTELWVTDQAPATLFGSMFEHGVGESADSPLSESSMILEVSFTSADGPETSYRMEVTEIRPDTLLLSTRDYAGGP